MSSNAPDPESLDDDTVRISRTGAQDAAADVIDDRTAVSFRREGAASDSAPVAVTDDLESTALSRSGAPEEPSPDATAEPGPRRAPIDGDDPEPDEGSTMVVRRETRRREARDLEALAAESAGPDQALASTRAADVPAPVRRIARTPEPAAVTYTARAPHVARVERTAPDAHARQAYVDTAAVDASVRARRRRGVVIGVVLGLCLMVAAVAGLVALVTAG